LLGDVVRRFAITDHGFMHYFAHVGDILWCGKWIANVNKGQVSDDAVARVLRWVEERGVTLELNSNPNTPETAEVRMLRTAADRGLPMVIGTDSHQRAQATNLSLAKHRLDVEEVGLRKSLP